MDDITWSWSNDARHGSMRVSGEFFEYPGYDSEQEARRAASRTLRIMFSNLGLKPPKLPPSPLTPL